MKAYIKSATAVSPQKTFEQDFPVDVIPYPDAQFLKCIEPVYKDYLDPMVSRRMSRIVKMGMCTALNCLRKADVEIPDAVIAGTGLGCLEDTEKFLASIIQHEEHLLNPTPFINSTHNTIAGAIALAIKCHGYNATYTHRGFTFESAVIDTLMLIAENPDARILTGAFDELTPTSYEITRRMGLWNKGTLPGEGVAFFLLTGIPHPDNLAQLVSLRTISRPKSENAAQDEILDFIRDSGLSVHDIDLAVMGLNGDPSTGDYYKHLMDGALSGIPVASFKHLCGEYDTSSAFSLWLSSQLICNQRLPQWVRLYGQNPGKINNILIYNHLRGINHSFYLLSAC